MSESELRRFLEVFSDPKTHPTVESIKTALSKIEITHLKVNYTFLQMMTEDDTVIYRENIPEDFFTLSKTAHGIDAETIKKVLAEQIILEGLDKSLSFQKLIEDPVTFSKTMIDTDISSSRELNSGKPETGLTLAQQFQRLTGEIKMANPVVEAIEPQKLADAVFAMRKDLLKGIEAQKALGVIFANEEAISKGINALTDQVIIRIVKEEYNQGAISIPRLAQIIRRLLPEPDEIKRLLPLLKEGLLAEGMSLVEFLRLIQELGKELENEGLVQVIKESTEHIGLSGEDLIKELKRDPTGSAELILLLLPMTDDKGSTLVLQRLLRILHSESFVVKNIPLELKFVALTTSFHQDNMPTIQIF